MKISALFYGIHLLTVCALTTHVTAQDDLFSSVTPLSTFDSTATKKQQPSLILKKLLSAEQIRTVMIEVGLEAEIVDHQTVSTTKEVSPWSFPVIVKITDDESRVEVLLGLRSIKTEEKGLTSADLISLMTLSRNNAPSMFVFNEQTKRTELISSMVNDHLTGQMIRDEITRLAVLARDNSAMWSRNDEPDLTSKPQSQTPSEVQTDPQTQTPATPPETTTQGSQTIKLTGRWLASKSQTEAFAVEFLADNQFRMVYVNGTTQSKSEGTFSLTENELTLKGAEGLTLKGRYKIRSEKSFQFVVSNGTELIFDKAK